MNKKNIITIKMPFNEFVFFLKVWMVNCNCSHLTGLVDSKYLSENLDDKQIENMLNKSLLNGRLISNNDGFSLDNYIFEIVCAWINSSNVIVIKKPSYAKNHLISVLKFKEKYYVADQNIINNTIIFSICESINSLYDCLKIHIDKETKVGKKNVEIANKLLDKFGSEPLEKHIKNQVLIETINNYTGDKIGKDLILYFSNNCIDVVEVDKKNILHYKKDKTKTESLILDYFNKNFTTESIKSDEVLNNQINEEEKDIENFTSFSYHNLKKSSKLNFNIKNFFVNLLRNFKITVFVRQIIIAIIIFIFSFIFNKYLPTINEKPLTLSFSTPESKFPLLDKFLSLCKDFTPFIFVGLIGNNMIKGYPNIKILNINSSNLALPFIFLLSITFANFINDIFNKKVKSNFNKIFKFRIYFNKYVNVSNLSIQFCIIIGLILATITNIIVFNPFAIFLLAILVFLSCAKQENGYISTLIMVIYSTIKYRRVEHKKCQAPLYSNIQLLLYGYSIGLFIVSIINIIVWNVFSFNFYIRILFSVVVIVLLIVGYYFKNKGINNLSIATLQIAIISPIIIVLLSKNTFAFDIPVDPILEQICADVLHNKRPFQDIGRYLSGYFFTSNGIAYSASKDVAFNTLITSFFANVISDAIVDTKRDLINSLTGKNEMKIDPNNIKFDVSMVPGINVVSSLVTDVKDLYVDIKNKDDIMTIIDLVYLQEDLVFGFDDIIESSLENTVSGVCFKGFDKNYVKHEINVARNMINNMLNSLENCECSINQQSYTNINTSYKIKNSNSVSEKYKNDEIDDEENTNKKKDIEETDDEENINKKKDIDETENEENIKKEKDISEENNIRHYK